jgi:hypothetical protein
MHEGRLWRILNSISDQSERVQMHSFTPPPSGLFQKLVNHPALPNDDDDDDDGNNNNNNRLVSITNLIHNLFIL